MAKPATLTRFTSARGNRAFLYLNGGSVKSAYNDARPAFGSFLSGGPDRVQNYAKIAVTVGDDGRLALVVKETQTHPYVAVRASDPTAARGMARALANPFGLPTHGAVVDLITAALTGENGDHPTWAAAWAVATDKAPDAPQPAPQPVPAPQPAPHGGQEHPTPAPAPVQPSATPAVQRGPSALASFGALGDAIRSDIDAAVAVAVEKAPKPTVQAITIVIPERKPITLPDGEVLHERFDRLLFSVTQQAPKDRNALLLGPRGSGKTHAAEQVARSLGLAFDAVSMSGGTTERAFWGSTIIRNGTMEWRPSRFVTMYEKGGVFLIDELDKADPTVVTALNMATSNGYIVPVDGPGRIDRHADFICIACANALHSDRAYTGSSRPDASTLERFDVIAWDYSKAITARAAAESGSAVHADWLIRLSDAIRARIASKGWRGEQEWSTRSVARVASWLRGGKTRTEALEWELESRPDNVRAELREVARGII